MYQAMKKSMGSIERRELGSAAGCTGAPVGCTSKSPHHPSSQARMGVPGPTSPHSCPRCRESSTGAGHRLQMQQEPGGPPPH